MDQIESLLDRPKFYYNIDGVGELGIGVMLLGCALLQWLQIHSPKGSIWNSWVALFLWIGLMLSIIDHGSKAIKKHITFPRTGFLEYQKRDTVWRPLVIALGASVLAGGMSFVLAARSHWDIGRSHWGLTTPAALFGLVFAASYAYRFAKAVRWKWAVVLAMAICSLVIALLPANLVGSLAKNSWLIATYPARSVGVLLLSISLYGMLILISGGISFLLYLRHTEPAAWIGE